LRHPNRGACISREAENAEFNTDENRDAILNSTAGWEIYHGARMLPVIGIEYSDSQDELEKGLSRINAPVLSYGTGE
jgi:hypothetical protein